MRGVAIDFVARPGGSMAFAYQQIQLASRYDIVIVMLGGNDLANGASVPALVDQAHRVAGALLSVGVRRVVFPSIWPRWNGAFNAKAWQYSMQIERRYQGCYDITGWIWDRRQPWLTYDGVHLEQAGYKKASRYLLSIVIWAIHHTQL